MNSETLGDASARKELELLTDALARLLGMQVPPGYVFALVLSKATGTRRSVACASTGHPPEVVWLLREMADKLATERAS